MAVSPKKRTKIIATLGPATDDEVVLRDLLEKGVDIVRLNYSHGSHADHQRRAQLVRKVASMLDYEVAILADLQGPKIRISRFAQGRIQLKKGDDFILDAALANDSGDQHQVGIDYKQLPQDVSPGDQLLLDDGRLVFQVKAVEGQKIYCQVLVGGELKNNKGINRLGGGLSAQALTEKDKEDMKAAIALEADYIAISFPRNAQDMQHAKSLMVELGSSAGVIAKIERAEAVIHIEEIIKASDGVMVARGDLGVEIGDAEVPGIQKFIIQAARALNKAVITATQMMESMVTNSIPTRAEVSDVANAVLDGTDAVMLSAETATGEHPQLVVDAMVRAIIGAERNPVSQTSKHRVECQFTRVDEAVAMAAMYTANHMKIKAIVCLTESGSTPLWMSRIRSGIPIYALSRHVSTQRKVILFRGVYPIAFDATKIKRVHVNQTAIRELKQRGIFQDEDLVIITKGDLLGVHGHTNSMKIIHVGELLAHDMS